MNKTKWKKLGKFVNNYDDILKTTILGNGLIIIFKSMMTGEHFRIISLAEEITTNIYIAISATKFLDEDISIKMIIKEFEQDD